MRFLSRLFGEKSKPAGVPLPEYKGPAWAAAFSVSTEPIAMCSQLTPENMIGEEPRQVPTADAMAAPTASSSEGLVRPLPGPDNAVPWPMPSPLGAQMLTFWGTGSARSEAFTLQSDAALRVVTRKGSIEVSVQREDQTFLSDRVCLDGNQVCLGMMAIPRSGTYSLVVESQTGMDWGVTVLYMGHPGF